MTTVSAPTTLYRCGFAGTPLDFADWGLARRGRFAGRFDDPRGNRGYPILPDAPASSYRVLYLAATAETAYLEALQGARADTRTLHGMAQVVTSAGDAPPPTAEADDALLANRCLHTVVVAARFADVAHSTVIEALETSLAPLLQTKRLDRLTAAEVYGHDRTLTQAIGRTLYEITDATGAPRYDGIAFDSVYGHDHRNFALFEGRGTWSEPNAASSVDKAQADVQAALGRLRVRAC